MEPVISRLDYSQHMRINDAAPDRTVGILAAYQYLEGRAMKLNMGIAVPALGIMIIALMLAVVAWAIR